MEQSKKLEIALILKALNQNYVLVDDSPDVDFLIFSSESREELDFYPKKELVKEMESSGLIENLDKNGSAFRESHTYLKGNPIKKEWKEITEVGSIVYNYRVTQKGLQHLSDVSNVSPKPLPPLKIAKSPVHIERKILKVVVYDQQTVQNLVNEFIEKAKRQIELALSANKETDFSLFTPRFLLCGQNLWQKIKSKTQKSGVQSELRLESRTFSGTGEVKKTQLL